MKIPSALRAQLLLCLLKSAHKSLADSPPLTCSAVDEEDPALQEMKFDIGYGEETFLAYVQPDVTTFYQGEAPGRRPVQPEFQGIAAKFSNMGNQHLLLYWDAGPGQPGALMERAQPFQSVGTGSFPTHKFYFTPEEDPGHRLVEFTVKAPFSNYFYDPYMVRGDPASTRKNLDALSFRDFQLYEQHKRTRLFNDKYFEVTGREYLAMYPRRRPTHHMWRADYFGQEHWVTTKETHFVKLPPDELLGEITVYGNARKLADNVPRLLHEYRTTEPIMNMTMTVISCAPRAFEIKNFLSEVEVDHILKLATGMDLSKSTTGSGDDSPDSSGDLKTRTSFNTWVSRERGPIVDAIYRRAADLLRIDEALMRYRGDGEYPDLGTEKSVAESLQLVHYAPGQEYTPHHDFGYSDFHRPTQEARFATLLLYLNEGMEGGETSFPRWVNAETSEELKVTPEKGKAVLFYSQLPDGNMDDLSQHAALPVKVGEKWLMNLWVHDPIYEH